MNASRWRRIVGAGAALVSVGMGGGAMASTTVVPPPDWGQMFAVAEAASGQAPNQLLYEFSVAPSAPLTISFTTVVSGYTPGSYQPGFGLLGTVFVRTDCCNATCIDAVQSFELFKPYTSAYSPDYTALRAGG